MDHALPEARRGQAEAVLFDDFVRRKPTPPFVGCQGNAASGLPQVADQPPGQSPSLLRPACWLVSPGGVCGVAQGKHLCSRYRRLSATRPHCRISSLLFLPGISGGIEGRNSGSGESMSQELRGAPFDILFSLSVAHAANFFCQTFGPYFVSHVCGPHSET